MNGWLKKTKNQFIFYYFLCCHKMRFNFSVLIHSNRYTSFFDVSQWNDFPYQKVPHSNIKFNDSIFAQIFVTNTQYVLFKVSLNWFYYALSQSLVAFLFDSLTMKNLPMILLFSDFIFCDLVKCKIMTEITLNGASPNLTYFGWGRGGVWSDSNP